MMTMAKTVVAFTSSAFNYSCVIDYMNYIKYILSEALALLICSTSYGSYRILHSRWSYIQACTYVLAACENGAANGWSRAKFQTNACALPTLAGCKPHLTVSRIACRSCLLRNQVVSVDYETRDDATSAKKQDAAYKAPLQRYETTYLYGTTTGRYLSSILESVPRRQCTPMDVPAIL